jgi:hypothetical protein
VSIGAKLSRGFTAYDRNVDIIAARAASNMARLVQPDMHNLVCTSSPSFCS